MRFCSRKVVTLQAYYKPFRVIDYGKIYQARDARPQWYWRNQVLLSFREAKKSLHQEFLKKAGAHGILDDGILKHALSKIAEQLVEELADGNTVTLDGIGTFQATLGVKKDKEMDTIDGDGPKRNAKSIEVKNVRYVSDKDLVNDVNLHCKLTRAGVSRVNRSPYTKEERLKMLQDYLADATHPFIRVADYAELTSLPRSTATKELRTFSENPANGITTSGRRTAIVYVKRVEI